MSEIEGLLWCLVVLSALLGLLYFVDIRVAAMPRLKEPPLEREEASSPATTAPVVTAPTEREGKLDA
ncbi:hypothetical protein ACOJCM_15815 [Billgrantia sp. LNSP4103-1]|uniref:hypothetical protein n=1 Tax=Billgrantia sp. LNSP4103-1 TaxID=3410266 RepID=UPI00403F0290